MIGIKKATQSRNGTHRKTSMRCLQLLCLLSLSGIRSWKKLSLIQEARIQAYSIFKKPFIVWHLVLWYATKREVERKKERKKEDSILIRCYAVSMSKGTYVHEAVGCRFYSLVIKDCLIVKMKHYCLLKRRQIFTSRHRRIHSSNDEIYTYYKYPGGGEIFRTRPDRPWGLPSFLYNGYRVFPGGKAAGAWCWPPTPSQCRGHERVDLCLYSPPGPQWPVIGRTFTFTYYKCSGLFNSFFSYLIGLTINFLIVCIAVNSMFQAEWFILVYGYNLQL